VVLNVRCRILSKLQMVWMNIELDLFPKFKVPLPYAVGEICCLQPQWAIFMFHHRNS
jgi:hypothetical protein